MYAMDQTMHHEHRAEAPRPRWDLRGRQTRRRSGRRRCSGDVERRRRQPDARVPRLTNPAESRRTRGGRCTGSGPRSGSFDDGDLADLIAADRFRSLPIASDRFRGQMRSMMIAGAMPPAAHIVTRP